MVRKSGDLNIILRDRVQAVVFAYESGLVQPGAGQAELARAISQRKYLAGPATRPRSSDQGFAHSRGS